MESLVTIQSTVRKILLMCGIISSLLYVAMLVVVPLYWYGYSSLSQTVSELSAVDAPTRSLWIMPAFMYSLLVILFGWAVIKSAASNRHLHIPGIFIFIYGIISLLWPLAPMHQREFLSAWGGTFTDTIHLILAAVTVLLMTLAIGFGAAAFGKPFRLYSIITILALLLFGLLTGMNASKVQSDLPTPWVGVWERINISVFLAWVIVLAIIILHRQKETDPININKLQVR